MNHSIYIILATLIITACSDGQNTPQVEPQPENFLFEDGFETNDNNLDELFISDASRWSTIQKTDPTSASNEISLFSTRSSEGESAIRFIAYQSDSQLSKIDIEKNGFQIYSGQKAIIGADFFIVGNDNIENLLLLDLECCSCWDPTVGDNFGAENQCPGVRLMMSGGNDFLSIERGKIAGSTFQNTSFSFPRDEWVSVRWEMTMADDDTGSNTLYINDFEVLNEMGMNIPNPEVFKQTFLNQGIDFALQEPVYYERVQVGATANPIAGDVELYVDNFSISVE